MKTKYYNYLLWEDWQNGMFRQTTENSEERILKAVELFKNQQQLYKAMQYVAFNWKISAEVNFTNPSINYQAWLGQASQCYKNQCSDMETIKAWHLLTDNERQIANDIADKVYYEWIEKYNQVITLFNYEDFLGDLE